MPPIIGVRRICVTEYGPYVSLDHQAKSIGVDAETVRRLLVQASRRVSTTLSVDAPVQFDGDRFRVVDVAGLIRIGPNVELEVRPKFLGAEDSWREDFFTIATIARYGRVFPREALRSAPGALGDLSDLLGHAAISLYDRNYRRPLRVYKRRKWTDFHIDGEVEEESMILPEEEGFAQTGLVLDRQNEYNQVIHSAMGALLAVVRDGDMRRQLSERRSRLSPQSQRGRMPGNRVLPSRHRSWQDLYDLSKRVLDGFGLGYGESASTLLPGYIMKTNESWESLIFTAVRIGMGDRTVEKRNYALGVRVPTGAPGRGIETTPDLSITRGDGSCFLADAKYKGRAQVGGREITAIQSGDLYESLAFMKAARTNRIVLVYPAAANMADGDVVGSTQVFETDQVGDNEIIGITVNPRGISGVNGFRTFSTNLCQGLMALGA